MAERVGLMMNRVRNSASPASTWLGGMLVRPSALRVIPRTMKTLVNDVQSSSRDGATESTVMPRMMISEVGGLVPSGLVPLTFRLMLGAVGFTGGVGEGARSGSATATAAGARPGSAAA